jgi:hypothetical protein
MRSRYTKALRKAQRGQQAEHDFATLELDGILLNRRTAKKLIRSGHPYKRAYGHALGRRMQDALDYGRTLKKDEA